MSTNAAVIDLRLPADQPAADRAHKVIAVIRRLVAPPRLPQAQPHLTIGGSSRIPDRRRGYEGRSHWVHTQH